MNMHDRVSTDLAPDLTKYALAAARLGATFDLLASAPQYAPQIARWVHAAWGYHDPEMTLDQRISEMTGRANRSALPITFIATLGAELVGTAGIILNDVADRPDLNPWLVDVWVPEPHRGNGIAAVLCDRVVRVAIALGINAIYLFTDSSIGMYEKLGWKLLENYEYRGDRGVIMTYCPSRHTELAVPGV